MIFDSATDEELDPLLRRMFDEMPVQRVTIDLARRARQLASGHASREIARVERLRRWALWLTVAGLIAIALYALHAAEVVIDQYSWMPTGTSNFSPNWGATSQLIFVTAVSGVAVAIGALLVVPALSSGEE